MTPVSLAAVTTTPPRPAEPDADLVRRHQEGDPRAFIEIVRRHHTDLFQLAHHLLRDVHDAEYITQATFALAHRALDRARLCSPLPVWLYHVAFKLARRRHWQNQQRRHDAAPPGRRTPATDLREFAALLATCVDRLDPRDCELLALRHVLGLTAGEIGRLLRIRPDIAWTRIGQAREGLLRLAQRATPRATGGVRRPPTVTATEEPVDLLPLGA